MTARAGGGDVRLAGSVGVTEFAPSRLAYNDWDVTLDVDDIDVDYRAKGWFGSTTIYKGPFWTHAEIKSAQPGAPARIAGRSSIHHCFFSTPPLKPSKTEKPEREGLYAAGRGVPNFGLDWHLDVGDVVQYRGSGLDARLMRREDAVVLTGTPQEPRIKAVLEYQSGFLTLYGNAKFRIEELRIEAEVAPETTSMADQETIFFAARTTGRI